MTRKDILFWVLNVTAALLACWTITWKTTQYGAPSVDYLLRLLPGVICITVAAPILCYVWLHVIKIAMRKYTRPNIFGDGYIKSFGMSLTAKSPLSVVDRVWMFVSIHHLTALALCTILAPFYGFALFLEGLAYFVTWGWIDLLFYIYAKRRIVG